MTAYGDNEGLDIDDKNHDDDERETMAEWQQPLAYLMGLPQELPEDYRIDNPPGLPRLWPTDWL
jgi:hypothetical protein